jgi:hypothetical protein
MRSFPQAEQYLQFLASRLFVPSFGKWNNYWLPQILVSFSYFWTESRVEQETSCGGVRTPWEGRKIRGILRRSWEILWGHTQVILWVGALFHGSLFFLIAAVACGLGSLSITHHGCLAILLTPKFILTSAPLHLLFPSYIQLWQNAIYPKNTYHE